MAEWISMTFDAGQFSLGLSTHFNIC